MFQLRVYYMRPEIDEEKEFEDLRFAGETIYYTEKECVNAYEAKLARLHEKFGNPSETWDRLEDGSSKGCSWMITQNDKVTIYYVGEEHQDPAEETLEVILRSTF